MMICCVYIKQQIFKQVRQIIQEQSKNKVPCNGAKRGLSWLYPAQKSFSDKLAISLMWELLDLIPPEWNQLMRRPFHVGAMELNLCEVDKYFKVKYCGLRCKRIRFYQDDYLWSGPQHRHEHSHIRRRKAAGKPKMLCWFCSHIIRKHRSCQNSILKCRNSQCSFALVGAI